MKIEDLLACTIDNRGKTPPVSSEGHCLLEINCIASKKKYPDYSLIRKYVSEDVYNTWFRSGHPQKGDILIPTVGTLDAVGICDRDDCCIAQNLIAFRVDSSVCEREYFYYLLCDPVIRKRVLQLDIGGVQPSIKVPHLKKLEIDIPNIEKQKRIAEVLARLDSKIQNNTIINKNLEEQARALFHHWVKSNQHRDFLCLSDIATINSDTYSPKENWEYVNYLDTSNITSGVIDNVEYIQPQTEKLPSRARRKVKRNDIVYSTVRPNQLHYGIISAPLPNMLVSTGFSVIRSNLSEVCNELIYLCITEPNFTEKMQQLAEQSTSAFPSIRPSDLGNCLIPIPEREDSSFTNLLKNFFSIISSNLAENRNLSTLRDTLLPRLMSGEIDVSSIEL